VTGYERRWVTPRPRPEPEPSKGLIALAVVTVPLVSVALISGVIQLTEWIADVDVVNRREAMAIGIGATLLRVVDIMLFREKRK